MTAQCIPESPGRCEDGRPQYIDVFQSVLAWDENGVRTLSVSSFQLWCLQAKSSSNPPVPTPALAPAPDPDPSTPRAPILPNSHYYPGRQRLRSGGFSASPFTPLQGALPSP